MTNRNINRAEMKQIARDEMAGKGGYHIEWYTHSRYIAQAVLCSHVTGLAIAYYPTADGSWVRG